MSLWVVCTLAVLPMCHKARFTHLCCLHYHVSSWKRKHDSLGRQGRNVLQVSMVHAYVLANQSRWKVKLHMPLCNCACRQAPLKAARDSAARGVRSQHISICYCACGTLLSSRWCCQPLMQSAGPCTHSVSPGSWQHVQNCFGCQLLLGNVFRVYSKQATAQAA